VKNTSILNENIELILFKMIKNILKIIGIIIVVVIIMSFFGFEKKTAIQLDISEEYKIGGFAVGLQAYTFRKFSVMESIENASRMGGRVIEFFPGQSLNPENPEKRFDHNASDKMILKVKEKLEEYDIKPVNFYVSDLPNDEIKIREVFEFASKLGVKALTSEPLLEAMDLIEEMVKEYDIMVAIHNHPPRFDDPNYRVWDPKYVLSMVENRDYRIGASADIGHWIRSGIKPIDGLQILEGRLVSLHLSDVDQFGEEGQDVIMGRGVGNMVGVLDELHRQGFGGHISIEYEANWDDNLPDVSQNIGFIRGWAATRGL
jgi:sugar phosphate isomerase/epimerase